MIIFSVILLVNIFYVFALDNNINVITGTGTVNSANIRLEWSDSTVSDNTIYYEIILDDNADFSSPMVENIILNTCGRKFFIHNSMENFKV